MTGAWFGLRTRHGAEYGGSWIDTDADGTPDPADSSPEGSYSYNGIEYPGVWSDMDNDQIPDAADPFPYQFGSYWYEGVEYGGTWADADGDGVPDPADPTPDPTYGGSYTYEGVEYPGPWSDGDGDGVPDPADSTPNGGYWYNGTEYGGEWMDSDGDSIPDPADAWPYDYWNGEPHYTYNGTEYAGEWADRDGDFIPDPADSWPDDPENGLDSDLDGLDNYTERTVTHTQTDDVDSDNDYLTDYEEVLIYHSDPNDAHSVQENQTVLDFAAVGATTDSDDDGLPDAVERAYASTEEVSPDVWLDGGGDLDSDGYTNLQAYLQGWDLKANLNTYDLDGDGITDVLEDSWNDVHPGILDKTVFADAVNDPDEDGVMNFEEASAGMDPGNASTRGGEVPDLYWWIWKRIIYGGEYPASLVGQYHAAFFASETNSSGVPPYYITADVDGDTIEDGLENFVYYCVPSHLPSRIAPSDSDGDGMGDVFEHRHASILNVRQADDAGPSTGMVIHPALPKWQDYVDWDALNQHRQDIGESALPDPNDPAYTTVEEYVEACQVGTNPLFSEFGQGEGYYQALGVYYYVLRFDPDNDGLSNLREFLLNTNPRIADSDGDGFEDGAEIRNQSDPTDRHQSPLDSVAGKLADMQAALADYISLRDSGTATYEQLLSQWAIVYQQSQSLQSTLSDLSAGNSSQSVQDAIDAAEDDVNDVTNQLGAQPEIFLSMQSRVLRGFEYDNTYYGSPYQGDSARWYDSWDPDGPADNVEHVDVADGVIRNPPAWQSLVEPHLQFPADMWHPSWGGHFNSTASHWGYWIDSVGTTNQRTRGIVRGRVRIEATAPVAEAVSRTFLSVRKVKYFLSNDPETVSLKLYEMQNLRAFYYMGGLSYFAGEQPDSVEVTPITLTIPAGARWSAPYSGSPPSLTRETPMNGVVVEEDCLLPVEVKVVNRDDPAKTWTTGPVTSGPLAYTSPTISEVSDVKNGDLISWSLPGLTGGSFQWWATGPSGSRKDAPSSVTGNEWKLEDPLDWLPGKWRIHCRYTPSGGAATEFDFEQNLGYRSPDITVIGWIDGAQINLPSGADEPLLRTWPSGTTPDWLSVESWMGTLPTRMTFLGQVAVGDVYTVPLSPDPARRYVNAYLIKSSPNDAPPAEFLKQWPGLEGRKMVDSDALNDFVNDKKKFRSFHRFQARFELDDSSKIKGSPHYLKQKTQVGDTPVDWLDDPAGETGPHDGTVNTAGESTQFNSKNGKTHSAKLADDFEQYTQGRISTKGILGSPVNMSGGHISKQLNNLKVPWIWSLIEFGAAHAKAVTTAAPEHEIFPVYHVYFNGKRLDTLTNSISETKMEEFIQLGEPNVP